ncbi:MAG: AAA family ATPase, partial [Paucibacter sp.]|nr:AAA family ATPase [Roseateles sp.]
FRHAILIMTSNLGAEALLALGEDEDIGHARLEVMDAVRKAFRPEFLNRLDDVLIFGRLGRDDMARIVDIQLARVNARLADRGISLVADEAAPGNRLLRLSAHTDGTGPGTEQVQLCHARKYLNGTYAARVRYDSSRAGDALVQAFYTAAPLRFDYDPEYSELDWEYLPYGGWDVAQPRLYSVSWQTVRIKPWDSYNASHEEFGFLTGWHVLVTQVADGHVRWFLDGREVALHGGRNHPVVPMAISFSDWFIREGPFAKSDAPRVYQEDVDWVFHAQDRVLSPAQVEAAVRDYRQRGVARVDEVPASGLESRCDL